MRVSAHERSEVAGGSRIDVLIVCSNQTRGSLHSANQWEEGHPSCSRGHIGQAFTISQLRRCPFYALSCKRECSRLLLLVSVQISVSLGTLRPLVDRRMIRV
jgi:hypothetical protein